MGTQIQSPGLTDTDILVDASRKLSAGMNYVADRRSRGLLQISIVSAMELTVGCRDKADLSRPRQFPGQVSVLPVSEGISLRAHELIETYYLSHGLLIPDALIAATALERGVRLHTNNIRHFQMIPGLVVERPY